MCVCICAGLFECRRSMNSRLGYVMSLSVKKGENKEMTFIFTMEYESIELKVFFFMYSNISMSLYFELFFITRDFPLKGRR